MESLSLEVSELQRSKDLKEAEWTAREQNYRRTIPKLEAKVSKTHYRKLKHLD